MNPDLLIGVLVGSGVFALNLWVRKDAKQRHARYRMQATLAAWLYAGKLREIRGVRNGKILR